MKRFDRSAVTGIAIAFIIVATSSTLQSVAQDEIPNMIKPNLDSTPTNSSDKIANEIVPQLEIPIIEDPTTVTPTTVAPTTETPTTIAPNITIPEIVPFNLSGISECPASFRDAYGAAFEHYFKDRPQILTSIVNASATDPQYDKAAQEFANLLASDPFIDSDQVRPLQYEKNFAWDFAKLSVNRYIPDGDFEVDVPMLMNGWRLPHCFPEESSEEHCTAEEWHNVKTFGYGCATFRHSVKSILGIEHSKSGVYIVMLYNKPPKSRHDQQISDVTHDKYHLVRIRGMSNDTGGLNAYYANDMISHINERRVGHGQVPLILSDSLSATANKVAQDWRCFPNCFANEKTEPQAWYFQSKTHMILGDNSVDIDTKSIVDEMMIIPPFCQSTANHSIEYCDKSAIDQFRFAGFGVATESKILTTVESDGNHTGPILHRITIHTVTFFDYHDDPKPLINNVVSNENNITNSMHHHSDIGQSENQILPAPIDPSEEHLEERIPLDENLSKNNVVDQKTNINDSMHHHSDNEQSENQILPAPIDPSNEHMEERIPLDKNLSKNNVVSQKTNINDSMHSHSDIEHSENQNIEMENKRKVISTTAQPSYVRSTIDPNKERIEERIPLDEDRSKNNILGHLTNIDDSMHRPSDIEQSENQNIEMEKVIPTTPQPSNVRSTIDSRASIDPSEGRVEMRIPLHEHRSKNSNKMLKGAKAEKTINHSDIQISAPINRDHMEKSYTTIPDYGLPPIPVQIHPTPRTTARPFATIKNSEQSRTDYYDTQTEVLPETVAPTTTARPFAPTELIKSNKKYKVDWDIFNFDQFQ